MAIKPNCSFKFTGYDVEDLGVRLTFVAQDPGPGLDTDYSIVVTPAELAAAGNMQAVLSLVTSKLQQRIRANGVASKLDQFIGQSIVI